MHKLQFRKNQIVVSLIILGFLFNPSNNVWWIRGESASTFTQPRSAIKQEVSVNIYFNLSSTNPIRTFKLNSSLSYLGVFYFSIMSLDFTQVNLFEVNWTDNPDVLFLARRFRNSHIERYADDSYQDFHFTNISTIESDYFSFSISLNQEYSEGQLILYYDFARHSDYRLHDEVSPKLIGHYNGGGVNTTYFTYIALLPYTNSISSISVWVEGSYEDEKQHFTLATPYDWINFTSMSKFNDPPKVYVRLDNLSSLVRVYSFTTPLVYGPDYTEPNDAGAGEIPLISVVGVISAFSLVVLLRRRINVPKRIK